MIETEKRPCPQGTGSGGWGHRTEHKYINTRVAGGSKCYEEKGSGVRGQSDGRDCFRQSSSGKGTCLGPSSEEQAMVELRPVRQQSGFTHSGSLLLQGL